MNIGLVDILVAMLTLAGYTLAACYFFYRLNEKSIEKSEQRHEKALEKNENHWREMFMYMSGRIDREKQ